MGGAVIAAGIQAGTSAAEATAAARQSKKSRRFIKEQRETAFQTQRVDLEKAGYNPLYAFQGGQGAAIANYQQPDLGSIQGIGEQLTSGYQALKLQKKDLRKKEADIHLTSAQNNTEFEKLNLIQAQKVLTRATTAKTAAEALILRHQEKGARIEAEIDTDGLGNLSRRVKRVIDAVNPLTKGVGGVKGR